MVRHAAARPIPMMTHAGEPAAASTPGAARPSRWRTVAMVAAQVVLILVAAEVVLRLVGYQPPDLRPRMALFPRFPAFYEPNRDLGWVLKPGLDWTGGEVGIPFRTDAFGRRMHGSNDAPGAAGPTLGGGETAADVDCLGDSSTFGFGVPGDQTYPARLEALLRGETGNQALRVRNLGVPGYTSYEARLLAERDRPHAPVTIVWFGFNDHFPALRSHTRGKSLLRRRIAYACFRSRACAYFFDWLTYRDPSAPPVTPPTPDAYYPDVPPEDYVHQLERTIRALRDAGSEPIVLVYPPLAVDDPLRLEIARFWQQPIELVDANLAAHVDYQQLTRQVATREGVRMVDLAPPFEAAGNAGLHFDWVHPNAAGQDLIARLVAPAVRDALAQRALVASPPSSN